MGTSPPGNNNMMQNQIPSPSSLSPKEQPESQLELPLDNLKPKDGRNSISNQKPMTKI